MIITKTPLRISFFGGGSDFPDHFRKFGGACLSAAINKYIYVIIKPNHSNPKDIIINYLNNYEVARSPGEIKHDLIKTAVIHYGLSEGVLFDGTEIATIADISGRGSGLGSSSSLLVGLINAITLEGRPPYGPALLAEKANYIELGLLERPQGVQDAYPAAYGGLRIYSFSDRYSATASFPMNTKTTDRLFDNLLMFSTGTTRQSKDVLKEQHQKTAVNVDHLQTLANMARDAWGCLRAGDLDQFGRMLGEGWKLKKKLSNQITNPEIDDMYTKAINAGALGGKLCGAGGGGYLLLYASEGEQTAVRSALSNYTELPIKSEQGGSHVIYTDR